MAVFAGKADLCVGGVIGFLPAQHQKRAAQDFFAHNVVVVGSLGRVGKHQILPILDGRANGDIPSVYNARQ